MLSREVTLHLSSSSSHCLRRIRKNLIIKMTKSLKIKTREINLKLMIIKMIIIEVNRVRSITLTIIAK